MVGRARRALVRARRDGDEVTASAARSLIAALQHAEAVPSTAPPPTDGPIAGAARGLGAGDVARRSLDAERIRAVVDRELAERRDGADELEAWGRHDAARRLRAEAAVIRALGGSGAPDAAGRPQPPLPGTTR